MRQVSGDWVRKSTPVKLMLAEFGCRPVSWQWCKLVCRYWNRLVSQSAYGYLKDAFGADLSLACGPDSGRVRCRPWSSDVLRMLSKCMPEYACEVKDFVANQQWSML